MDSITWSELWKLSICCLFLLFIYFMVMRIRYMMKCYLDPLYAFYRSTGWIERLVRTQKTLESERL